MAIIRKVVGIIEVGRSRGLLIVYTLSLAIEVTNKVIIRSSYS
jgi:hypothetical protein